MEIKNKNLSFFLMGGTVLLAIMFLGILFEPDIMNAYFFADRDDTFMDYYNCIVEVSSLKVAYREGYNIYPPFCWALFYIFRLFSGDGEVERIVEMEGRYGLRGYQAPLMSYMLLSIVMILLLFSLFLRICRGRQFEKKWLGFLFIFSIPFLFLIERGNILILSFAGTLIFFALKDSERWWVRDIGYLCLAIAAAIKIYPAIFGFLLLAERKYKEAARLAVYGIMIFVISFLVVGKEGLLDIPFFFQNILGFNFGFRDMVANHAVEESSAAELIEEVVEAAEAVAIDGGRIGFAAFMEYLFMWFGLSLGHAVDWASKLGTVMSVLVFGISFFAGKKWQTILLLSCVLVGAQGRSYVYTAVFMIIPCLFFLNEEKESRRNYIYLLLFGLVLFPLPLGWTEHLHEELYYYYHRSFNDLQIGGAIWLLAIFGSVDIIIQYIQKKRRDRNELCLNR